MCLLCFGVKKIGSTGGVPWGRLIYKMCPLCKGTGIQTPELVWNYKRGENALDQLQALA